MKKVISSMIFIVILVVSFIKINDVVIDKQINRYYMLEMELKDKTDSYDVQVFGSCHAYTSFNPIYLASEYGISGYNMANPSEIIPVTYLRMLDQFKKQKPEVALVEIWGINAYDTYIGSDAIFESYLKPNIELLPINKEKIEVINDIETLDILNENIPLAKYKNRIVELDLTADDFIYDYDHLKRENIDEYPMLFYEMDNRFEHNGYYFYESTALEDYLERQAWVSPDEMQEPEPLMMKYLDKIIELCEAYDVELIFYRAPYISNVTELRKLNYIKNYFAEKNVRFYNLEEEIPFDIMVDFYDYQHLSNVGAKKCTEYLGDIIETILSNRN